MPIVDLTQTPSTLLAAQSLLLRQACAFLCGESEMVLDSRHVLVMLAAGEALRRHLARADAQEKEPSNVRR